MDMCGSFFSILYAIKPTLIRIINNKGNTVEKLNKLDTKEYINPSTTMLTKENRANFIGLLNKNVFKKILVCFVDLFMLVPFLSVLL